MLRKTIKEQLDAIALSALCGGTAGGARFMLEPPPKGFSGDFAYNAALVIAKERGENPRAAAQRLSGVVTERLVPDTLAGCEIAGPGFLNLTVSESLLVRSFNDVVRKEFAPDRQAMGRERVCVEFVSANPTGPLHVGHGRGAAIGDALARIFAHLGASVTREYYVNDMGNQMELLGRSLAARVSELAGEPADFPEDGYRGEYLRDIAQVYRQSGSTEPHREYARTAIQHMIDEELRRFGVVFDVWSAERALYASGVVDALTKRFRDAGHIYENEGALWLASTRAGDEKDRVVKRTDGRYTYLASDIAYHQDKINRGFTRLIDIWGADHQGYQKRLEMAVSALGFDPSRLSLVLYQLVKLLRAGTVVSMSTRSGEFVTLREVIDEVGVDACRFFFLLRGPGSHLDFDLDLAKRQSADNPVYYVQYAHARIKSIFKEAVRRGIPLASDGAHQLERITEAPERELALRVVSFVDVLERCAADLTPHYIPNYLIDTVRCFHSFYDHCRVLSDDQPTTRNRLALIDGVARMIKTGLAVLGVSAPESM